jgi:regulator of telomere elongation helicase 1
MNAGVGFKQIQELNPRSIILTSGTLAPLPTFQAELQVPFNQQLENPHVIKPDQVFISILRQGVNNNKFSFNYQNKDNTDMLDDLACTIASVAKTVPGGILVFFPSYSLMNKCYE